MIISASYKDIKQKQDFAFSVNNAPNNMALAICDGIGQYEDSGKAAKEVIDLFFQDLTTNIKDLQLFVNSANKQLKELEIIGGTTFICGIVKQEKIKISYLGNGGVIHCFGDFAINSMTNLPYRFSEIMLPHVNKKGHLTKHISHNSGENELQLSSLELNLNSPVGDILLFYTDGINSSEENFILKDDEGRFWRKESTVIQIILKELNLWLNTKNASEIKEDIKFFNKEILEKLNDDGLLEDDASLGIIITDSVLEYYHNLKHSND